MNDLKPSTDEILLMEIVIKEDVVSTCGLKNGDTLILKRPRIPKDGSVDPYVEVLTSDNKFVAGLIELPVSNLMDAGKCLTAKFIEDTYKNTHKKLYLIDISMVDI